VVNIVRGLVIGRFQPFHKGHYSVVDEVLRKCDDLVMVIGSAQESHTARNPFTAGERYLMISSSLSPEERLRTAIIPVPDVNRYSVWVAHVESYVPPFDIVFSNSDLTRSLFSQAGYAVKKTKAYKPGLYSATAIRVKIAAGGNWWNLVPSPVASIIEGLDGRERLVTAGLGPSRKRGGARCART
jgi:nicotinamide-nucleotide adenylyltransferase